MPHKFNADRCDKIPKQKRRVTDCAAYDAWRPGCLFGLGDCALPDLWHGVQATTAANL